MRKIYTKVIIDTMTGNIEDSESFMYDGAIASCEPMTILTIASTAFSVIGALSQAGAASDAANYNASLAARNAEIAKQQGEAAVVQQKTINYQRLSAIKAATGASGGTQEGSALDILESSAAQAELDIQNIRYNASLKAMGYTDTYNLQSTAADTAATQGIYGAAAAGLTGAGNVISLQGTGTKIPTLGFEDSNDYGY